MENSSEAAPVSTGDNENTQPENNQTGNANISKSESSNIAWEGNPDYFQSGKKAGQLKPRANKATAPKEMRGLDIEGLRATENVTEQATAPAQISKDKKALQAEKKLVEAKVAAKFAMRILDTLVGWVSKGTYGADFTTQQRSERNKYREELEQDWQDYLITLDIPMHPALVAIFGSMLYVAPAFETKAGQERTQSIKEKIVSKIAVGIFNRAAKKP